MISRDWKRQRFDELLRRFGDDLWALTEDSHRKGARWEEDFARMAHERGFAVGTVIGRADLLVNGKRVQCKNCDMEKNGWVDISNRMPVKSNGGLRGYLASEVDVVALRHRDRVYLIPSAVLANESGVLQSRVQTDRLGPFVDGWGIFETGYVPPETHKQTTFLDVEWQR